MEGWTSVDTCLASGKHREGSFGYAVGCVCVYKSVCECVCACMHVCGAAGHNPCLSALSLQRLAESSLGCLAEGEGWAYCGTPKGVRVSRVSTCPLFLTQGRGHPCLNAEAVKSPHWLGSLERDAEQKGELLSF